MRIVNKAQTLTIPVCWNMEQKGECQHSPFARIFVTVDPCSEGRHHSKIEHVPQESGAGGGLWCATKWRSVYMEYCALLHELMRCDKISAFRCFGNFVLA